MNKNWKIYFLEAYRNEVFSQIFLRFTNSEKIIFSSHFSIGIFKKDTYAKFLRKTINSAELDLLEILNFLDKRPTFW